MHVKLSFYCGHYKGMHDFSTESEECCNSGFITVGEDDWLEGYVSHKCDYCGNVLYQCDDHFEEVE